MVKRVAHGSSGYRWWALVASTAAQWCAAVASQGISIWGDYAQHRFMLSHTQLGMLAGLASAVPILGLALVGPILDQRGERSVVFVAMMVLAIALLWLGLAQSVPGLVLAMVLIGIGYSPIQPGGSKAIFHWFPVSQRGLAMGIRQAALPLAGALAAVVLPPLLAHYGWHIAFNVAATLVALGGAFFVMIYRHPPAHSARSGRRVLPWHGFRRHFTQKHFRDIAVLGIVLVAAQTAISLFWIVYLRHQFGTSLQRAAAQLVLLQVAGSLGRMILSRVSDYYTERRLVVVRACVWVNVIGVTLIASMSGTWPIWSLTFISMMIGFFSFGWYGPWVVGLSESADTDKVGEVLGLAMSLTIFSDFRSARQYLVD